MTSGQRQAIEARHQPKTVTTGIEWAPETHRKHIACTESDEYIVDWPCDTEQMRIALVEAEQENERLERELQRCEEGHLA